MRVLAALGAIAFHAIADIHQVIQTRVVVLEPLKELRNRHCLGHIQPSCGRNMAWLYT
jgi:hypothetical protein